MVEAQFRQGKKNIPPLILTRFLVKEGNYGGRVLVETFEEVVALQEDLGIGADFICVEGIDFDVLLSLPSPSLSHQSAWRRQEGEKSG